MSNDHSDNESMHSNLIYCEESFDEKFDEELMVLEELDRHTFPTRFFDKSFVEIFDDELRFIANDHACLSESGDDVIGLIANAKGVTHLSD